MCRHALQCQSVLLSKGDADTGVHIGQANPRQAVSLSGSLAKRLKLFNHLV